MGSHKWVLFLCLCLCGAAGADQRIVFQSTLDNFELNLTSHGGMVDGKTANLTTMKDLLPLLTNPLGNECGIVLKEKPGITVTVGGSTRLIYGKQGVISDGKACLNVAGDGLFYFPLHRDFLIGPKQGSIRLQSPLKVFRQGSKILSLKKTDKGNDADWQNELPELMLDWDFFERFENSLNNYDIRGRAQLGLADGKPKVLVQSGDQTYEFYKLTQKLWGVKRPGMKWLETSDDWSFWYDLGPNVIEDHYAAQIRFVEDNNGDKDSRLAALEKLAGNWSRNLRELYHQLLLKKNDPDIQAVALKRLKYKPSLETAGVMVKFLESSNDDNLKHDAGVILKLQNPKGPLYKVNTSAAEKAKTVEFWRQWWNSISNEHP